VGDGGGGRGGEEGATTASAGTRRTEVAPTSSAVLTEVVVPRVCVEPVLTGPTMGSHAPEPIGPPS
jgi:hypothetical protein